MSASNTSTPSISLDSLKPSDDQWRLWREGRNAQYWQAAMLTLQVQPSIKNRDLLKEHFPEVYKEYKNRISVIRRRSKSNRSIKNIAASTNNPSKKNQFVALPHVAKLALSIDWDRACIFANHILHTNKDIPINEFSNSGVNVTYLRKIEEMGVRERRLMVKIAALAELVRTAATSPNEFAASYPSILKNPKLSSEALGEAIEAMVLNFSNRAGCHRLPYGYKKNGNADELNLAKAVVFDELGKFKKEVLES